METWKDVIGYKGLYKVSNLGRVRSMDRISKMGRIISAQLIAPVINNTGYCRVHLSNFKGTKWHFIHRLVAMAFLPPSENNEVNHIDGNKQNNNPENLEWCTHSENIQHAIHVLGKIVGGSKKKIA